MANRLTGEERPLITSKVTLRDPQVSMTMTYPLNSQTSADVTRLLAGGATVIRAWDVLWPADGGKPRVLADTGYLP